MDKCYLSLREETETLHDYTQNECKKTDETVEESFKKENERRKSRK